MSVKHRALLVGGGSVGAVAALNLEKSQLIDTTVVCRSNFDVVSRSGYTIESCDHGIVHNFRPFQVTDKVPEARSADAHQSFDYVVCVTKNCADIAPPLTELLGPAITPGKTIIVLIQNGLNIEKPLIAAFPQNIVLSGVSLIGASEPEPGRIEQDFPDTLYIGAFRNPHLDPAVEKAAAEDFAKIYSAGGKTNCSYSPDVGWTRWRKLVYNACLNPICAITGLDTGRIRLADGTIEGLVRPAMHEILQAAKASGHELPADVVDHMIDVDPVRLYLSPSMLSDTPKGNFVEFETILGEPLREGEKLGVAMPTLRVLYHLCQAIQWKNKELKGMVEVPPRERPAK